MGNVSFGSHRGLPRLGKPACGISLKASRNFEPFPYPKAYTHNLSDMTHESDLNHYYEELLLALNSCTTAVELNPKSCISP